MLCLIPVFFWKFIGLGSFSGVDIFACLELYQVGEQEEKEGPLVLMEGWRNTKQASQVHEWIKIKK